MRSIPPKTLREIRDALEYLELGHPYPGDWKRLVAAIDRALETKRSVKASRSRRAQKQKTRKEEWAEIREKVLARAGGKCEFCGYQGPSTSVDHMFGGSGRRRTLQSVYTCWNLCHFDHHNKTANHPDAATWLIRFINHCVAQAAKCGDFDFDNPDGYARAADIARARLDSLTIQARSKAQEAGT